LWGVIGLGNPGRKYTKTRHNAGFMAVDEVLKRLRIELKEKSDYLITEGSIGGEKLFFMEPLTFMNLSGKAVRMGMRKTGVKPEHLIVIHDDLDMPTGRLKIKVGGGAGGHKGVLSIFEHIGSREFIHIKIGIGKDINVPIENYVLRKFSPDEQVLINEAIQMAADAVESIVTEGAEAAMLKHHSQR
jgi:PTH1 family peptidyl-tRNA hydrolase